MSTKWRPSDDRVDESNDFIYKFDEHELWFRKCLTHHINTNQMKHLAYRIALIFAIMGLSCANAFAQQVKGTVKDASGYPVIGAAVIVEGTSIGTTVDLDGAFVLNDAVPSDAILVVSSIGYKTAYVPVGGQLRHHP